ncbi:MAG: hypothetical protein J6S34_03125 [Clostridia bacterium]|nr:hypothetical protein [Clostridia bacterium]
MTQKKNLRAPIWYASLTVFVLVFGIVYTHFGHGVTSDHMTYAFLPLLAVTVLYLLFPFVKAIPRPERFSATFLAFSVASFTLWRITQGVLQIAGAYSDYDNILYITAIICLVIAIILYPTEIVWKKKTSESKEVDS